MAFTLRANSGGSALKNDSYLREADPVIPSSIDAPVNITALETLGCGEWVAVLTTKGGTGVMYEIPFTSLSCNRRLNESSDASITINQGDLNTSCCDVISTLSPFKYELHLYRNGELSWLGPILDINYTRTSCTLTAKDLFYWFERRILDVNVSEVYGDLSHLMTVMFNVGYGQDTSPGITLNAQATNRSTTRGTQGAEFRRVADEMKELTNLGLDFTMYGRTLYSWLSEESPFPDLPILQADDFADDLTLNLPGTDFGNDIIVTGNNDSSTGLVNFGRANGWEHQNDDLGLITVMLSDSHELSDAGLRFSAMQRLRYYRANPVIPSGSFSPHALLDFSQLIPGVKSDLRLVVGCRTVMDTFKLDGIDVQVDTNNATESITPTFSPIGLTFLEFPAEPGALVNDPNAPSP